MSYDICLVDSVTKETLVLDHPHQMRGGTYQVGGSTHAHLNVTYNYSRHFYRVLGDDGIRILYGKCAADTIPVLQKAISLLGDDVSSDYWQPTEGNAKRALTQLLALAKLRPDGIWDGD